MRSPGYIRTKTAIAHVLLVALAALPVASGWETARETRREPTRETTRETALSDDGGAAARDDGARLTSVKHVIHIVVDGLKPEAMAGNHNFDLLRANGVGTDNARNDLDSAQTLPNHISMFTGLSVAEHGYYKDDANGRDRLNLQNIFDLVKESGGRTGFFGAKDKFEIFDNSWNIDEFFFQKRGHRLLAAFLQEMHDREIRDTLFNYVFVHFREPDRAGHLYDGSKSNRYAAAVAEVDGYLGQIFQMIESSSLRDETAIVLTSDHGFEYQ